MSHDFNQELNALRENLPAVVEEAAASKSISAIPYSADLAERIASDYSQGLSLHAISKKGEMPAYSTLLRWFKTHPEFSKMLRSVREARAAHFEDLAIETADKAAGKDADRIKVDTYIWAAEVNDPAVYGKKVQASHDIKGDGRVVIQVVTGFGPPNAWQTPPKLNPDGTIDKSYTATPVESEVSSDGSKDGIPVSSGDSAGDGGAVVPDRDAALSTVAGHEAEARGEAGASLRSSECEVPGQEDALGVGATGRDG